MQKVFKFIGVGVVATLVDYGVYLAVIMTVLGGDTDKAWAATMISGVVATGAAYLMHSRITWKTRDPGKFGVVKFFIWNGITVLAIRPILTLIFDKLTGLYAFAFGISEFLHLPFSYEFIEGTGIFGLMTCVTMILNYSVYERFVFGTKKVAEKAKKQED